MRGGGPDTAPSSVSTLKGYAGADAGGPAAQLGSGLNAGRRLADRRARRALRRPLSAPPLPRPGEDPVQLWKERVFVLYLTLLMQQRGYLFILEPEQRERLIP